MPKKQYQIHLTDEERSSLTGLLKKGTIAARAKSMWRVGWKRSSLPGNRHATPIRCKSTGGLPLLLLVKSCIVSIRHLRNGRLLDHNQS